VPAPTFQVSRSHPQVVSGWIRIDLELKRSEWTVNEDGEYSEREEITRPGGSFLALPYTFVKK